MLPSEIKENNKILIAVDSLEFESEIILKKEEYMLIKLIVIEDKIVNFPKDLKVNLVYFEESDKLFIWEDVKITPVKYKDGNKYHKVNMPVEEGKKYNRRSNYRLYVGEEMYVELKKGAEYHKKKVMIRDVSATGFAFLFNEEYEVGNRATLYYSSKTGKKLELPSKIVRKQIMDNINTNLYGCQYIEQSDIMRKIINAQQQEAMRNKLR